MPKPFSAEILYGSNKNGCCQYTCPKHNPKHFALMTFFTCFYVWKLRVYQFLELFKKFQNSNFSLTLHHW